VRRGKGRTGCALAVLAVLGGISPVDAVTWVRVSYDRRAVETPWQRRWIQHLDLNERSDLGPYICNQCLDKAEADGGWA
jgi:protein-tyrosine phosphatase